MYEKQKRKYYIKIIIVIAIIVAIAVAIIHFSIFSPNSKGVNESNIENNMTISSLEYISGLISLIALGFSLYNFLKEEKPAKVKIIPAEKIVIISGKNKIGFHVPITFINESYNAGVVSRCELEISDNKGYHQIIPWDKFCKDTGHIWEPDGMAHPIAVMKDNSFSKVITFMPTFSPDKINIGPHIVTFKIWMPKDKKEHYKSSEYSIYIDDDIQKKIQVSLRDEKSMANVDAILDEMKNK